MKSSLLFSQKSSILAAVSPVFTPCRRDGAAFGRALPGKKLAALGGPPALFPDPRGCRSLKTCDFIRNHRPFPQRFPGYTCLRKPHREVGAMIAWQRFSDTMNLNERTASGPGIHALPGPFLMKRSRVIRLHGRKGRSALAGASMSAERCG